MNNEHTPRRRSEIWFNDMAEPGETVVYIERFANYGITREELQSGRPMIGIAHSGGIPFEFPIHPLQESCRRPTAALDRNLAYLGLVEILCGYPLDGVVLMTGCDKTTPACLMAAATVNLPAIVLSGGPMINSYINGKLAGSGMALWQARRQLAAGRITEQKLVGQVCPGGPRAGAVNSTV